MALTMDSTLAEAIVTTVWTVALVKVATADEAMTVMAA